MVVVSPHLDDAVLSVWGELVASPGAVALTVFAGRPERGRPVAEWDRRCGYDDPHTAATSRREADVEALRRCGGTAVHLDHLDRDYRTEPDAELLPRLAAELREHLAQASSVWLPLGVGLHPDHRLVARATLLATRGLPVAVHVYADQPYASLWGWPAWVLDGSAPRMPAAWTRFPLRARTRTPPMQWSAALAYLRLPRTLPHTVRPLSATELPAKLHALEPYTEQLAQLSYGPYGTWTLEQAMGYEAWWDLRSTSASSRA